MRDLIDRPIVQDNFGKSPQWLTKNLKQSIDYVEDRTGRITDSFKSSNEKASLVEAEADKKHGSIKKIRVRYKATNKSSSQRLKQIDRILNNQFESIQPVFADEKSTLHDYLVINTSVSKQSKSINDLFAINFDYRMLLDTVLKNTIIREALSRKLQPFSKFISSDVDEDVAAELSNLVTEQITRCSSYNTRSKNNLNFITCAILFLSHLKEDMLNDIEITRESIFITVLAKDKSKEACIEAYYDELNENEFDLTDIYLSLHQNGDYIATYSGNVYDVFVDALTILFKH